MQDDLVRLRVSDVAVAVPAGPGVEAGMVTLQEDQPPYRLLQIYVGQPEARAIRVSWRREVPARPSTWDLFVSSLSLLGGKVEAAVLSDVEERRHFFAHLVLRQADDERGPLVVSARPSDAIALALRTYGAAVWCRRHVLDAAGVPGDLPGLDRTTADGATADSTAEPGATADSTAEPGAGDAGEAGARPSWLADLPAPPPEPAPPEPALSPEPVPPTERPADPTAG